MELEFSIGNLGDLVSAGVVSKSWSEIGENLAFKVKGSISSKDRQQRQFSARWGAKDGLTFGAAYIYKLFEYESPQTGPMAGKDLSASLVVGPSFTVNAPNIKGSNGFALMDLNINARFQMSFNAKFANYFAYDYPVASITLYRTATEDGYRNTLSFALGYSGNTISD
jgi:hypothetical protein